MSSHSEPGLGAVGLVSEAWRIAISAPVATGITALIVAAVCGFVLSTTGQTVRAEQDVLGRIDDAGTRLVSAIDDQGTAVITPEAVQRIRQLSSVEWVIGLGPATDVKNTAIGEDGVPVALRFWWGDAPTEITLNGRTPQAGEALVGSDAQAILGLDLPVGSVDIEGTQIPVVGGFTATDALVSLNNVLLANPGPNTEGDELRSVHVLAVSPSQVGPLTTAVGQILGAEDPSSVRFATSQTLADVRAAVAGEFGKFSRQLVLAALAIGLILVAIVIYGSVNLRRQDYGRRRALGATRVTIILLVSIQNTLVGIVGATLGIAVGTIIVWQLTLSLPDTRFSVAIAVLALITVTIATIPPSLVAAYRDPVTVLRLP